MRRLGILLVVAACYSPHARPGTTCAENGVCPAGLVCSPGTDTCELSVSDAPSSTPADATLDDATLVDAFVPLIDGCSPTAEICGDGIDQDCNGSDAICPANDRPSGAIDITMGGSFPIDLATANVDDPGHGCGPGGGRDVFYKVSLGSPDVYYLDTFGATFDTVIRAYPGKACTAIGATGATCSNDACGTTRSQLAVAFPSGTSCVVLAQAATETLSGGTLKVVKTGHTGIALPAFVSGTTSGATTTTCGLASATATPCSATPPGPSLDYYFLTCPGMHKIDVSDCDATWDSVAYLKTATYAEVDCNDDSTDNPQPQCSQSPGSNSYLFGAPANGPALYWAGIGGYTPNDCGSFTVTVTQH